MGSAVIKSLASRKRQRPPQVASPACGGGLGWGDVDGKANYSGRLPLRLAILCALLSLGAAAVAQEEPPMEEYVPAVPSPRALENAAVRATLAMPREKPSDYVRRAVNLLNLGEPGLAENDLRELVALGLDDAAKAKLVTELGPAPLLRLSRDPAMGADVAAFVQSVLAAALEAEASDQRVGEQIEQLSSGDELTRNRAVSALAAAGERAVVPLVQLLASENTGQAARQGARAALVRLGRFAERPLLAALESGNTMLVAEAAEILARLRTPQAAPLLAVPALGGGSAGRAYEALTGQQPSREAAEALLQRTMENLEGGVPVFDASADGTIEYWVWSGKPIDDEKPVPLVLTVREANTLYMSEVASQLAELRPDLPSRRLRALRLAIEWVAIVNGDRIGPSLEDLPSNELDGLLADALDANQVAAAVAALEEVARRKDAGMLPTKDGLPSPTAAALEHPHPTVRTAALEAIAAIDSPTPFPGASKVCPAIVALLSATGERKVLTVAPRLERATTWAGGLAQRGFAPSVATVGEQAIELANQDADIELVMVDMLVSRPDVRDTVFSLRRQPGSALLPIVLLAGEAQLSRARTIASEHERVQARPRPYSDMVLMEIADAALAELPSNWPTPEDRLTQADIATQVAAQLLEDDRQFYRLRAASEMLVGRLQPTQADDAGWTVLENLGTHESQVALLGLASAPALGLASREAAVAAFEQSVEQFGVRITTEEITRQYDRYNVSATQPRESQQVLGRLLDIIEGSRQAADAPLATPAPEK